MVKNLQVVSFDSEWLEIYLGTVCKATITRFQIVLNVLYQLDWFELQISSFLF